MKIEIGIKDTDGDVLREKTIDIPVDRILKGLTKLSVLSFVGSEINRIRPARRNVGRVFNWMGAFALTDAIMNFAFPKKEAVVGEAKADECEVVEEKEYEDEQ